MRNFKNNNIPMTCQFQNMMYLMVLTKNVYFRLVKLITFLPKKFKFLKWLQQALEDIINILDTNLSVPVTYRLRNIMNLVILTKNASFRSPIWPLLL